MRLIDGDALKEYFFRPYSNEESYSNIELERIIDAQPTIEERKTGKWIELTNANHTYVCSVCGRMLVNITDGKNTVTIKYPFCHCGAKMIGVEN